MLVGVIFGLTIERGNFGRWGNLGQGPKKHFTLSQSFDFLALVSAFEVVTTVKKLKLSSKLSASSAAVQSYPVLQHISMQTSYDPNPNHR